MTAKMLPLAIAIAMSVACSRGDNDQASSQNSTPAQTPSQTAAATSPADTMQPPDVVIGAPSKETFSQPQIAPPPAGALDANAARIQFRKGSYSGSESGTIAGGSIDYILRARADQVMTIDVSDGVRFAVYSLGSDISGGASHWSDTLPRTGDYHIRVFRSNTQTGQGAAVDYTLNVEIR